MQFAEIYHAFVAPHLAGREIHIPRDHLLVVYAGVANKQSLSSSLSFLQEAGSVPLQLVQVLNHEQAEIWPLLAKASLILTDGSEIGRRYGLRAMAADLPVLHLAGTAIQNAGLEVTGSEPGNIAAAIRLILTEPWLRRELVRRQRAFLESCDSAYVAAILRVEADSSPARVSGSYDWLLEGPFDDFCSQAVVNRSLALALEEDGQQVDLVSLKGLGPLAPDPAFLAREPEIERMWQRADFVLSRDVVLRNLYPPSVLDMRGLTRVLVNYDWKESGLPVDFVSAFNSSLNLVTVTNRFVAKTLRDNGIRVPIAVVGHGVSSPLAGVTKNSEPSDVFRFLHVASPLHPEGVGTLLAAWGKGFSLADGVELLVRTVSDFHEQVGDQIAALDLDYPHHAPVRLIHEDVAVDQLHALYAMADAVVCPIWGEGGEEPLVEALWHGKPVVSTSFGSRWSICTPDTAWLCDFSFSYSRSHLGITASVLAAPDEGSLIEAMHEVRAASSQEIARRVNNGQALLRERCRWDLVARKTRAAIEALEKLDSTVLRMPKIGWVSTWNTRCGIATYSEALTFGLPPDLLTIFASRNATLEGSDAANVRRCWTQGWVEDDLEELYAAIRAEGVEALVLQFNLSFFPFNALCRLVDRVEADGIPVFLFFHSTMDVERPMGGYVRLADGLASLSQATRVVVHTVSDLNRLKNIGLVDNVMLFPHGLPEPFGGDRKAIRRTLGVDDRVVLATFGFLLPHKGLREIIRAVGLMRHSNPDIHLMMLNALYPADVSREELEACKALIRAEGLEHCITIEAGFLSEGEIISRLSAADIVVYPYQNTQESASGAVRLGLASGTPVACTPLQIFEDIAAVVRTLPGISPEDLASGLTDMLADRSVLAKQAEMQAQWSRQIVWPVIRNRLEGVIRGILLDKRMAGYGAPLA